MDLLIPLLIACGALTFLYSTVLLTEVEHEVEVLEKA